MYLSLRVTSQPRKTSLPIYVSSSRRASRLRMFWAITSTTSRLHPILGCCFNPSSKSSEASSTGYVPASLRRLQACGSQDVLDGLSTDQTEGTSMATECGMSSTGLIGKQKEMQRGFLG